MHGKAVAGSCRAGRERRMPVTRISDDLARRLALFLYLLERPAGARADEILRDLPRHYKLDGVDVESAKRTLRRDIEKLARDGFYIGYDAGMRAPDADGEGHVPGGLPRDAEPAAATNAPKGEGRYRIDAERTFAARVSLDDDEAAFLRVACASLLQDPSYPRASELLGALVRLAELLDVPDTLLPLMDGGMSKPSLPTSILKVRRALEGKGTLSFSYTDARGASTRRNVVPLRVFTFDRRLYLVAVDAEGGTDGSGDEAGAAIGAGDGENGGTGGADGQGGAGDAGAGRGDGEPLRVFRLDRMSRVKGGGKAPAGAFAVQGADAWPCLPFQFSRKRFPAQVRFSAAAYARASALTMRRGVFTVQPGGGAVWEVEASDARALAAWCVECGPGLQPLAPAQAAEEFAAILDGAERACHAR